MDQKISKPIWSVGQKPNTKVVNYKTDEGIKMGKISTGDRSKVSRTQQLPSYDGKRATYGMSNLKVRANQRFMKVSTTSQSREVSNIENLNLDPMQSQIEKKFMSTTQIDDSLINSMRMCVPTANTVNDE